MMVVNFHLSYWLSSLPPHTLPLGDEPSTAQGRSREGEVLVSHLAENQQVKKPQYLINQYQLSCSGELQTHIQHHHKAQQALGTRTSTLKYSPALHTFDLFWDFLI